jgi:predicted metal-dependent enzyme (double-stranded beta helix superfamily)
MFDIDRFIGECRVAVHEHDPRRAVREVLERAVSDPDAMGEALEPTEGGLTLLHNAPDLTVLHVVWAPGMRLYPHDHKMWAAIGIYEGQEDNEFFRRAGQDRRRLEGSGGRSIAVGDVLLLGDDVIHAVTNPLGRLTAAIHVYAGDFVNEPRSQWGPGPVEERPYDLEAARRQFAEANAAWRSSAADAAAGET